MTRTQKIDAVGFGANLPIPDPPNLIVSARYEDLPDTVRHEAKRTLLNWVGYPSVGSLNVRSLG